MRGVLTSALGIGDGYDEQLLRGIAENGGGRLHDAELTGEISSVLLGELDDIFRTIVEDAEIALAAPAGVRVDVLGRGHAESSGERILVPLGPVQDGIERVAVFKVTCPKARRDEELVFEMTASGRTANDRAMLETETARIRLVAADGTTNKAQRRDLEVAAVVARTWSAHIVVMAARMNRDRAYDGARKYVKRELRHFRDYVGGLDRGREMIHEIELLAARVGHRFSSRIRKEMVLQSSLAIESRFDRRGGGKAAWSSRMRRGD